MDIILPSPDRCMSLLFLWNTNLKVIIAYCFFWLIFLPILFFSFSQTSLPAYTFPSPALICSPWDLQFSCVRGRVGGGRYISPCSLFNKDYSYKLRAGMFTKAERFYSRERKTLLAEINSNWLSCIIIASREAENCWKTKKQVYAFYFSDGCVCLKLSTLVIYWQCTGVSEFTELYVASCSSELLICHWLLVGWLDEQSLNQSLIV